MNSSSKRLTTRITMLIYYSISGIKWSWYWSASNTGFFGVLPTSILGSTKIPLSEQNSESKKNTVNRMLQFLFKCLFYFLKRLSVCWGALGWSVCAVKQTKAGHEIWLTLEYNLNIKNNKEWNSELDLRARLIEYIYLQMFILYIWLSNISGKDM